jgi:hypothetical protein
MSRAWGFNTFIYKAPTPISNIARQRPSPGFSEVKEGLKWADTTAIAENVCLGAFDTKRHALNSRGVNGRRKVSGTKLSEIKSAEV